MINEHVKAGSVSHHKIGWEKWHVLSIRVGRLLNFRLITPRLTVSICYAGRGVTINTPPLRGESDG